jgi:hypothetical protein
MALLVGQLGGCHQWTFGFEFPAFSVVFVVDNVGLGQVSHQMLLFSSATLFPQVSRIHSCNRTLYIHSS